MVSAEVLFRVVKIVADSVGAKKADELVGALLDWRLEEIVEWISNSQDSEDAFFIGDQDHLIEKLRERFGQGETDG